MPVYSNDVADKVLRVLQSANRLDQQKLADARSSGTGASSDVLERMIRTARRALEAPPLAGADHRSPGWVAEAARIEEVAEAARSFAAIRSRHDSVLIPEAWDENV